MKCGVKTKQYVNYRLDGRNFLGVSGEIRGTRSFDITM